MSYPCFQKSYFKRGGFELRAVSYEHWVCTLKRSKTIFTVERVVLAEVKSGW